MAFPPEASLISGDTLLGWEGHLTYVHLRRGGALGSAWPRLAPALS